MGEPVGSGCACSQGVFQSSVEALYSAVCMGMIGGGLHVGDVEERVECRPQ
jgi:hypothetical protein